MAHVQNPFSESTQIFSVGGYVDYDNWVAPISPETYRIIARELGLPIFVAPSEIRGENPIDWLQREFCKSGVENAKRFEFFKEEKVAEGFPQFYIEIHGIADSYRNEKGEWVEYIRVWLQAVDESDSNVNWLYNLYKYWGRIRTYYPDARMIVRPPDLTNGFSTLAARRGNWHSGFQISEPCHRGWPGVLFGWNDSWEDVKSACKKVDLRKYTHGIKHPELIVE